MTAQVAGYVRPGLSSLLLGLTLPNPSRCWRLGGGGVSQWGGALMCARSLSLPLKFLNKKYLKDIYLHS